MRFPWEGGHTHSEFVRFCGLSDNSSLFKKLSPSTNKLFPDFAPIAKHFLATCSVAALIFGCPKTRKSESQFSPRMASLRGKKIRRSTVRWVGLVFVSLSVIDPVSVEIVLYNKHARSWVACLVAASSQTMDFHYDLVIYYLNVVHIKFMSRFPDWWGQCSTYNSGGIPDSRSRNPSCFITSFHVVIFPGVIVTRDGVAVRKA